MKSWVYNKLSFKFGISCNLQVFVANPNKSPAILDILKKNKNKLLDFINQFHTHRTEDEQFNDEKNYLISQIQEL